MKKHERALEVLKLIGEGLSIQQIADRLNRPVKTIYKHVTAFRCLAGKYGIERQQQAFNALFYVRLDLSQMDVARSRVVGYDHKFISDLCAMDWAMRTMLTNINAKAIAAMIERGLTAEQRDRESIREHVANLSEAFDDFLCALPDDPAPKLQDAITDLTESIIEIEALLGK
ncbi:helix-turn-helix domain-containing protein [Vibrio parahaemolyticus]